MELNNYSIATHFMCYGFFLGRNSYRFVVPVETYAGIVHFELVDGQQFYKKNKINKQMWMAFA